MPERSALKALLLSVAVTLLVAVLVVLCRILQSTSVSSGTGIGSVSGGLGETFLSTLLFGLPIVFLVTFLLLRRRKISR